MADYYTKLSFMVPFKGEAAEFFQGILQYADLVGAGDDPPADMEPRLLAAAKEAYSRGGDNTSGVNVVPDGDELWISDDCGSPSVDLLFAAIQLTLARFKMENIVSFEWSGDCSKARLDAYGGGAGVISAKRSRFINTGQWAADVVHKWNKKKCKTR